ncbi:hypothetical protein MTO96_002339 [Rhipicephalus appendiculatus]
MHASKYVMDKRRPYVLLCPTQQPGDYLEVTEKDVGSWLGTSGQQGHDGDDHSADAFPSLLDILNVIYIILAIIGACCACCCCCLLCLPEKDDYQLRTIVMRDPHGNEKVYRFRSGMSVQEITAPVTVAGF